MQLFKSQCVQEDPTRRHSVGYRGYRSRLRYGGRGARQPNEAEVAVGHNVVVDDARFRAEREVLRELARYEHAA